MMGGLMTMAAATLLMATDIGRESYSRRWELPRSDDGPITQAERNRLLNASAAKKRAKAKRSAAKKARKAKR